MASDAEVLRASRPGLASRWGLAAALMLLAPVAAAEELPITGNTGLALDVSCALSLNFGVVSIPGGNSPGSVSVAPSLAGGVTTTSFLVTGHQRGRCDVTEVGSIATVAVSGGGGSWNSLTRKLTGARLLMGSDSLEVVIEIDKAIVLASGAVTPIYIGGTLNVPANFSAFGTYSQTFTLTVTE